MGREAYESLQLRSILKKHPLLLRRLQFGSLLLLHAAAGTLLEIAQVRVPNPIEGSVDGLLVFDSYGGPALAERVNKTESWRRLVLYRIVPPAQESSDESSIEPPRHSPSPLL